MKDKILELFTFFMYSSMSKPYIWGGDDPIKGFDCSGLVLEWLKTCGFMPNHLDITAQGIYDYIKEKNTRFSLESLDKGCLLFFGKSNQTITHVAIAVSPKFMFEAGGGDSTTTSADTASKQNAYVRIRPIASRKDLICYLTPKY
jgi:cell wall-associated NlpC family hydrolase